MTQSGVIHWYYYQLYVLVCYAFTWQRSGPKQLLPLTDGKFSSLHYLIQTAIKSQRAMYGRSQPR